MKERVSQCNHKVFLLITIGIVLLSTILITTSCVSSHDESESTSTELSDGSPTVQTDNTITTDEESTTITENEKEPKPAIVVSGKSIGSIAAPITIVEYSDFQCYYCQQFALEIQPLIDIHYIQTGKVRFVYKHLIAFGNESGLAAEASECAAEQNQFWPYYKELMRLGLSSSIEDLSIEKVYELARQVGLNMTLFYNSLESSKFYDKVMQDDTEGRSSGFSLIPTFLINGVQVDSQAIDSFEEFSKILDAELELLGE